MSKDKDKIEMKHSLQFISAISISDTSNWDKTI